MEHPSTNTSTVNPAQAKNVPRDDRILIEVRAIAAFVIFILLLAFVILYIFPENTAIWFSWTVKPNLTPMLMGAGYLAGAFFFFRVLTEQSWHRVQLGFLPITSFTILMLLATLLHWDRFHQGALAFYLWTAVYILTPLLVPFLWWRNRVADPGNADSLDYQLPKRVRQMLAMVSCCGIIVSLILFAFPDLFIGISPWTLTPLTARVGAGWVVLASATVLSIASDPRWSAARNLVQAGMIGIALMLLAFLRAWADLNQANVLTWLFIAAFAFLLINFAIIHLTLDARRRRTS
jgi:hypothetical protein